MFAAFRSALRSSAERHYRLPRQTYGAQALYGHSLTTDDGLCSIGPVANTTSQIATAANDRM